MAEGCVWVGLRLHVKGKIRGYRKVTLQMYTRVGYCVLHFVLVGDERGGGIGGGKVHGPPADPT